jgi:hypothetical protein
MPRTQRDPGLGRLQHSGFSPGNRLVHPWALLPPEEHLSARWPPYLCKDYRRPGGRNFNADVTEPLRDGGAAGADLRGVEAGPQRRAHDQGNREQRC